MTETVSVQDLQFDGIVNPGPGLWVKCVEKLNSLTCTFMFGTTYLLDALPNGGSWALSWIIGGIIQPDHGTILRNGIPFSLKERRRNVWCVRHSSIKWLRLRQPTVEAEVQYGFKHVSGQYLRSEAEIIERFYLTPERYKRPLSQQSSEAWRASCAIGLANGKKIFCFPPITWSNPGFIEEYYSLWLKSTIDVLKESGALVLIPADAKGKALSLCDEIVSIG